jgi:hypothetical protein
VLHALWAQIASNLFTNIAQHCKWTHSLEGDFGKGAIHKALDERVSKNGLQHRFTNSTQQDVAELQVHQDRLNAAVRGCLKSANGRPDQTPLQRLLSRSELV